MCSEETRTLLKEGSHAPGQKLIELQRLGWDKVGLDKDFGCACLDKLGILYPGDTDLETKCKDFIQTAMRIYLQALQDRKPAKLEEKAPMSRAKILEFFDACNTKMNTEDFQQYLTDHMTKTRQVPNELIITAQRDMLEVLGFARDHGCMCLSRIGHDFPGDEHLVKMFNYWRQLGTTVCMKVVKDWKEASGEEPQVSEEHQKMMEGQRMAMKDVSEMTPEAQQELLAKFQKKMECFMKLPAESRMDYVRKMPDDQRVEFMKAQVLLMTKMRGQQQAGCPQQQAQMSADGPKVVAGVTAPKPSQQQMM